MYALTLLPLFVVPGPQTTAQDHRPLMSMTCGDLADFVQHPKDEGLRRAFGMLDDRLAELPSDLGDDMPPPARAALDPSALPTWIRLMRAPKTVQFDVSASALANGDMPFRFGVAVHEDSPEAATQLEAEVRSLVQQMGAPMPPEMLVRDQSSLVVGNGTLPQAMGGTRAAEMLGSGAPLLAEMRMDVGAYFDFLEGVMMETGAAPPEAARIFDVVGRMGLDDCVMEVASTGDDRVSRSVAIMTNIGGKMKAAGLLPEEGLTAAHFAPIPADAHWASVERFDMAAGFEALNTLVSELMQEQMGGGDLSDMVASTVGIDLRNGVFGALGDVCGMYASDTTGGGGMTSMVMYFSLRDSEALLQSTEQIQSMLNGFGQMMAQGYVNARTWTRGDGEYTTLTFPGLPVPLEPTIAMTESWLFIAATPQAALGAVEHVASGENGLASHRSIAPLLADGSKNAVSFFDAAHYARKGYGATSVLLSGLGNAMRSRMDETRDPGPILPPYPAFAEGILPTVGYGELRGDDYVNVSVGDASTVVQMAAMTGSLSELAPLFAAALAAESAPDIARTIRRNF
ncbi:MAG: hypothetical protein AAF726_04195 [Planctomycetota bacterium]